jgi:EmrB/QacA subfamily drug resistance transporter
LAVHLDSREQRIPRRAGGKQDGVSVTRPWLALAVVNLAVIVITLDNTIVNVALPSIQRSLHASSSQLQWTVDAYTLVFASLLLTAGTVGDRYGRRGTLMAGLVVFGTGSALAAFAPDAHWLIADRAAMGFGAAAIFPTTLSIITNLFRGRERARAIAIWAAMAAVGVALGPILGGLLLDSWWWGSVLLVNVPIVGACVLLLPLVVPTSRDPNARRVDIGGAALSIAGLTALLYGIIDAPRRGWTSTDVVVALIVGAAILVVFGIWEHRTPDAMLPLEFFGDARFTAATVALSLTFFGLLGYIFLLTQYLQFVRDLSPLAAGFRLAPPALGLLIGAPLSARFAERVGAKIVVASGLSCAAASLVLQSRVTVLAHDGWLTPVFALFGFGMGMTMAPATESIMGSVPPARAGVGSAVNDTTRQTGGALGVAVLGSLAGTRYNTRIDALHLPAPLASAAKQSIGAATQVARHLPGAAGQRLIANTRAGFTSGITLATLIGAGIVAAAALIVALFLPAHAKEPS